jgi:hypothetical protein
LTSLPDPICSPLPETAPIKFQHKSRRHLGLITSPLFAETVDARLPTLTEVDVGRLLVGGELSA